MASIEPEVFISGGDLLFHNCDIQGSGGSGKSWNSTLGADGGGNLMTDPRFVNAAIPVGADGQWRTSDDGLSLEWGSACMNTGGATGAPKTDILGNPRIGTPDIGAYEYHGSKSSVAGWDVYQ